MASAGREIAVTPLTRRFAAPSPRSAGRGISHEFLLPACGEKVAGGRMRGHQNFITIAAMRLTSFFLIPGLGGRVL